MWISCVGTYAWILNQNFVVFLESAIINYPFGKIVGTYSYNIVNKIENSSEFNWIRIKKRSKIRGNMHILEKKNNLLIVT